MSRLVWLFPALLVLLPQMVSLSPQMQLQLPRLYSSNLLLETNEQAQNTPKPVGSTPQAYAAAIAALEEWLAQQVRDKGLPALSIALVDDQQIIWNRGFGFQDVDRKVAASADTIYRVGSISKLFTDLAIMELVERGNLDLDDPVKKYLDDFAPGNSFKVDPTLRHLMTHRSGLVRETPIGSYFDADEPSLQRSVESLRHTELLFEPGTRTQYSNAGIAVLGRVIEESRKQRFARHIDRVIFSTWDMRSSSFEADKTLLARRAHALMWTYHGREFPAPTFELGTPPAGGMYSTSGDLGTFLCALFAGGKGKRGRSVVSEKTLRQMMTIQFEGKGQKDKKDKKSTKSGFGLGFFVDELDGHKRVGHGGAVYGYATTLSALPEQKLGVVVLASRDCANGITDRIAQESLRFMLAVRQKKPLPTFQRTISLIPGFASQLAGRYVGEDPKKDGHMDLVVGGDRLYLLPSKGGMRLELRELERPGKKDLIQTVLAIDDPLRVGDVVLVDYLEGFTLRVGDKKYKRIPVERPSAPPEKWRGLIGEYGPDHNTLVILERDGKLHALIEWFFLYPLREVSENHYRFPDYGLYPNEKILFRRDKSGRATEVQAAEVLFKRRRIEGEDGGTFQIKPLKPIEELRKLAQKATPPVQKGNFRPSDLVDLTKVVPGVQLDIRYAGKNNFLGTPFYPVSRAYLQRPAAKALAGVQARLEKEGFGLLVFDGYRPWAVTKMFWDATPNDKKVFVADPMQGSRHNRGCAVDLTLVDRKTGKPVEMPGGYDEMSDRSYVNYLGGTSQQRWYRELLRRTMHEEGFTPYEAEWWHYDFRDWRRYAIENIPLEQLK